MLKKGKEDEVKRGTYSPLKTSGIILTYSWHFTISLILIGAKGDVHPLAVGKSR